MTNRLSNRFDFISIIRTLATLCLVSGVISPARGQASADATPREFVVRYSVAASGGETDVAQVEISSSNDCDEAWMERAMDEHARLCLDLFPESASVEVKGLVAREEKKTSSTLTLVRRRKPSAALTGAAASDPVTVGSFELQVIEAATGPVSVRDMFGNVRTDRQDGLVVRLQLRNSSQSAPLAYRSPGTISDPLGERATVVDDHGQVLRLRPSTTSGRIVGQLERATIEPEGEIEDVLVFEAPKAGSVPTLLRIPAGYFGGGQPVEISLKR